MMEKNKIRISRFSFLGNYLLGISLLIFLLVAYLTIQPSIIIIYFLLAIVFLFILEPEGVILYTSYILETDYVSEIKGFVVKKQTAIPYRNIVDERLKKGIIGRVFNFGDIVISGSKTEIKMRGIRKPEDIYREIEKKLGLLHVERE